MKLTQKQEWLVARYLRAFTEELSTLSDSARDIAVSQVRNRLAKELELLDSFEDEAVLNLLKRIGHPTQLAKEVLTDRPKTPSFALANEGRVWLGVCAGLARYFEIQASQARWAAVACGIITGPLALIAYLALYFFMYTQSKTATPAIPAIVPARLGMGLLGTVAVLVVLDLAAKAIVFGVNTAFVFGLKKPLPNLGDWDWLPAYEGSLVFWAFFTLVPLVVFSSLPAANEWDTTAKRLVQAGVCLYALALCAGVASYLVGAIIEATQSLAGL